jgi:hypothetical protein
MEYTVSTISKIDERFDINRIPHYTKSIQLSLDGFSYIVTDPQLQTHLALRNYNFGTALSLTRLSEIVEDLFLNEDILSQSRTNFNLSFISRPWGMVPEMLFDASKIDDIFRINFPDNDYADTISKHIPGMEIVFASRMPHVLMDAIPKDINPNFIPQQVPLVINALQELASNRLSSGLFLAVYQQFFDVLFIENGKLRFYNNFRYDQYDDILYFTLATMEELSLSPDEVNVFLQGNELVKEIIPGELKRHVKNIYLDKNWRGLSYSHHFDQLPLYQYKLLTGIYACE